MFITSTTITTTSETTTPPTTSITEINVLTPKELEEQCKQPVAIASGVSMLVMVQVHLIGMFAFFTKLDKVLNPKRTAATVRQRKSANLVTPQ